MVLFVARKLHYLDAVLACGAGLAGLGAAGRVADMRPAPRRGANGVNGPRLAMAAAALASAGVLTWALIGQPARSRWPAALK